MGIKLHTMTYLQLAYLHLATVLPAFFLGAYLLFKPKGTPKHRRVGRVYMAFMLLTALITLFMPAQVGPALWGHWGFIHLFSLLVLYCVPAAVVAARQHRTRAHAANMLGVYVGGVLVAGAFTFAPGRLLHSWVWAGSPVGYAAGHMA
ncbi:MAG: hypothetical protein RL297_1602 [Pseudomonadota bacterium]